VIVAASVIWCELELSCATRTFDKSSYGKPVLDEKLPPFFENLSEQKKQRATWAYAALAGLVAIAITKEKIIQVTWFRPAYVLLAAASVCLLESLQASEMFDRRLAYLLLQDSVLDSDVDGLSAVLWTQLNFLYVAVVALGLFVMSFVAAILLGKGTPIDKGGG